MVNGRALTRKEWDSIPWDGDVWEDPRKAENFEPPDSQEFISPEEVVPSAPPLEKLPFSFFIEEINPSLAAKPGAKVIPGKTILMTPTNSCL